MDTNHSPAVYALLQLHAELGGKIKDNQREAVKLRVDMKHVEAVLHLLQPEFNARRIAPRRRYNPNPLFKRGTLFRAALDVLRASPEPMTVDEISRALFRSKGVSEPSRDDMRRMYGAVAASLDNHAGKTVEGDQCHPRRWRLI
ncbi:hypothetical protein ACUN0C_10245 [Faunimonas sp. B44]|uniref:hypothetical protein n=1 Tax=Faunimonas sp. B44 TaxID=3461493 RepID=UPI00404479FA